MAVGLLNYETSFLNPLLKLLSALIFIVVIYYFYKARKVYDGSVKKIMTAFLIATILGIVAMWFRYLGDVLNIGWKWGESIFLLAFAVASLSAVIYALKIAGGSE